jgi:hypothetical protein
MASFLLAFVLDQLTLTSLAGQASQLGSLVLLLAFSLMLLAGLSLLGKLIITSFCDYFSARQRLERKVLFYMGKHNRLNRLFYFKKARLLYVTQQKRKHLVKKNDRKSVTS